jgi:hypothetical protein
MEEMEAAQETALQQAEETDQFNQHLADLEHLDYFPQHSMEDSLEVEQLQLQQELIDVAEEEAEQTVLEHLVEMAAEEMEDQECTQMYLVHQFTMHLEAMGLHQIAVLDQGGQDHLTAQADKEQQMDTLTVQARLVLLDLTE